MISNNIQHESPIYGRNILNVLTVQLYLYTSIYLATLKAVKKLE